MKIKINIKGEIQDYAKNIYQRVTKNVNIVKAKLHNTYEEGMRNRCALFQSLDFMIPSYNSCCFVDFY